MPTMARRQPYSKEQWDAQKPTIWRLYNVENLPFIRVLELLQKDHGFFPTRRQFYRKISQWGFEKNLKKSEMRAIVQSISQGKTEWKDGIPDLKVHQVNPARIERWQKKHGRKTDYAPPLSVVHPSDDHSSSLNLFEISKQCTGRMLTRGSADHTSWSDAKVRKLSQLPGREFEENGWTAVDVPGSPYLSRLFEALRMECPLEIPPLDIGSPISRIADEYIETEMKEFSDASQLDEDMSLGSNSNESCGSVSSSDARSEQDIFSAVAAFATPEQSFSEWTLSGWDFSRGCPYSSQLNPLAGLSPFPAWPTVDEGYVTPLDDLSASSQSGRLAVETAICETRLSELKATHGEGSIETLRTMIELAGIRKDNSEFTSAEQLYGQVAVSTQYILGPKHPTTLYAQLQIIQVMVNQGRYVKAAQLHPRLHQTIVEIVCPEDELAMESTEIKAEICHNLHNYEEAESLYRELLQIRLNALGPRSNRTLYALRHLAGALRYKRQLAESEQLLRTAVNLHYEVKGRPRTRLYSDLRELSRALEDQGRYTECCSLAKHVAEQSEAFLGPDHPGTLRCYFEVACSLERQGLSQESVDVFQRILEQQSRIRGINHPDTLQTMAFLAWTLSTIGRYREATIHFEIYFNRTVEDYGKEHSYVADVCSMFGQCYENQGRYEEALALYHQTVLPIRGAKGDKHPSVKHINDRIYYVCDLICKKSEMVTPEEYHPTMNGGRTLDQRLVAQDIIMREQDWMDDLFDFQMLEKEG